MSAIALLKLFFGFGPQGGTGSYNKKAQGFTLGSNDVVRRRTRVSQPNTSAQQSVKAAFSFFTSAWSSSLSESDRQAWEVARGQSYYYKSNPQTQVQEPYKSGKDLYQAMNTNYLAGAGLIAAPVETFPIPGETAGQDAIGVTSVVIDASSGTVVLTYTGTWNDELGYIVMSSPQTAGTMSRKAIQGGMRQIDQDFGASPVAMGSNYTAQFGPITSATGKKVFWDLYGVDTGTGKVRLIAGGTTTIVA